jgi:DNA sulfur modification protein DndE
MPIESIRLSEKERQKLILLKRKTGIQNWNVLCRWAFCLSLAESSTPPLEHLSSDSSVEMSWKVFAGPHGPVFDALLRERARRDGFDLAGPNQTYFLRLHINRGLSYLNKVSTSLSVSTLLAKAISPP